MDPWENARRWWAFLKFVQKAIRRGSGDERNLHEILRELEETGKIDKGPRGQWNHYSIFGSLHGGIGFTENQINRVEDNLKKLP